MKTVSLFEYETTLVEKVPHERHLTEAEVAALESAQRAMGVRAFEWCARDRIRAAEQVGVIATPNVRLEILPKIESQGDTGCRHVLIRMIAIAWDVEVRDGEITSLESQNRDLLEILIGLFARRLANEVRGGLSKSYSRHEADLSRLRGKMDVVRQFTRLATSPQKIACRYDEFTADMGLNRLLLCAAGFLRRRSTNADTQRLLGEIAAHFEDVSVVPIRIALAERFTLLRADQRWRSIAALARLLLSSIYQTAHGGEKDGIALVFDMNKLFEAYVAALVRKACAPRGLKVTAQGPRRCLARDASGGAAFRTKPDVHVECGASALIIDSKWKRIDQGKANFGVSQSDAYQMYGYASVYSCDSTLLLYPHSREVGPSPGVQGTWRFEADGGMLLLATIDVANPHGFVAAIGNLLDQRAAPQARSRHA